MSENTKKLDLFKYNTETDGKQTFNLNIGLNDNWDKLENKISVSEYSTTAEYPKGYWVRGELNGERKLFESLVEQNIGRELSDATAWKELSFGGSGLEVCDIGMALYVDETKGLRRYLNGQIVDINTNTQAFLNRLKDITTLHPSLLCTEEQWQTAKTMSAFGQVGKFVFNYSGNEIVSVRLPRVVNVQGLFDLQNLGMTVEAGLPNITGSIQSPVSIIGYGNEGNNMTFSGAFSGKVTTNSAVDSSTTNNTNCYEYDFDASKSNSIYGKSNTVQPEAIQYPYFIQIATGSETENNIINEIELNNPYSLFDSKYSDHELNNLSWLKSEGQWNSGTVYVDAYNELLVEYNNDESVEETEGTVTFKRTPKGYKIALSTQEAAILNKYNTDGIAWYYIIDTVNSQFKLPLTKFGFEGVRTSVGDDIEAGLPNIKGQLWTGDVGDSGTHVNGLSTDDNGGIFYKGELVNGYNESAGSKNYVPRYDFSRASSIYKDDVTTVQPPATQMYLYFYVGETVQNANLIDAGRIGEQLATKTDMLQASGASMPSNRYIDLTLGASGTTYTAPANGYYFIASQGTGTNNWIEFRNGDISQGVYGTLGWGFKLSLPIAKGHTTELAYFNINTTNYTFRFVYAEGEV